jgi:predicted DNA binding CopG/RHH family protein
MIPFDEIDERLKILGKTRVWLAETTKRSAGSIRSALAKNAQKKHRSDLLQKALSDAIEAEERALLNPIAQTTAAPPDRITVEVDPERMSRYLEAAKEAEQDIKSWTIHELNRAADAWLAEKNRRANISIVADDVKTYGNQGNG